MGNDGFVEALAITTFNKYINLNQYRMHKFGVTVEKIVEVLEKSESVIEVKTSEDKLSLRNKDWANIMTVIFLCNRLRN